MPAAWGQSRLSHLIHLHTAFPLHVPARIVAANTFILPDLPPCPALHAPHASTLSIPNLDHLTLQYESSANLPFALSPPSLN